MIRTKVTTVLAFGLIIFVCFPTKLVSSQKNESGKWVSLEFI